MKFILITLMLPFTSFAQNISTKDFIDLFEKHRNDTAYIVKYAFKHGFKERILIRSQDLELNSLEIVWYNDSSDAVYTEFLTVFLTEPHFTLAYRTAKREHFVKWYADMPLLGFKRVWHINGRGFTKTVFRKGKIGVILYQDTEKTEFDKYDMSIGYDFSDDYKN